MRIALVLPPWKKVPPDGYGGIETVASALINGLRSLGHSVSIFSVGTSAAPTDATYAYFDDEQFGRIFEPFNDVSPVVVAHLQHALNVIREDGAFDLVHDFAGIEAHLLLWANLDTQHYPPVLFTLHGPLQRDLMKLVCRGPSRFQIVGVSHAQIDGCHTEPWFESRLAGVIYNGVELSQLALSENKRDYFLTFARHTRGKGQDLAARLCSHLGARLQLCGCIGVLDTPDQVNAALHDPASKAWGNEDFRYFAEEVQPFIEPGRIDYMGNKGGNEKVELLGSALALLNFLTWNEPFGVNTIEALACGTPVITTDRGAGPEIVQHGVSGFVASTAQELEHYMRLVLQGKAGLAPSDCRTRAEEFSAERMCLAYQDAYLNLLARTDGGQR